MAGYYSEPPFPRVGIYVKWLNIDKLNHKSTGILQEYITWPSRDWGVHFGAIALEAGDYKLAEKNLKAAVQRSKGKGFKQVLTGSYLHLAQLYYRLGDPSRGQRFLRIALESAEDNQYVTFPNLYFPTLVEMAAQCIKNDIHSDYAKALICRFFWKYGRRISG